MFGFFFGHPYPVGNKFIGQGAESVGGVERQIDGVEFDMANRMQQRAIPLRRGHFALHQFDGRHQLGLFGMTRQAEIQGFAIAARKRAAHRFGSQLLHQAAFFCRMVFQ